MKLDFINYRDSADRIIWDIPNIIENLFDEKTLVVYDIRSVIIEEALPHIPHVATYDQRVVPLLHNATLVCSEPFPVAILRYYKLHGLCQGAEVMTLPHQAGMTLTDQILHNDELCEKLKNVWYNRLVTFLPTQQSEKLAVKIGLPLHNSFSVSQAANDKVALKEFLMTSWLPVIPGIITSDVDVLREYSQRDEKYFIKMAHGASGYGLFVTHDQPIEDIIDGCNGERVIVEPKIWVVASPAVQFYCDEEKIYIVSIADQILECGRYYIGNTYPSVYAKGKLGDEMIRQAEVVLAYIHATWYRGFGCVDMMVSDDDTVYIAEVNARFVGHTPASMVNFMLHKDINKPWKFIAYDEHEDSEDNVLSATHGESFPICIGSLDTWKKAQFLER